MRPNSAAGTPASLISRAFADADRWGPEPQPGSSVLDVTFPALIVSPPTIAGYEISRVVHHGGQGIVYEATQISTGQRVAIKLLRPGLATDDAGRRRFEREAELITQLRHPNVVTVFDAGQAGGVSFLVMEYVDGRSIDAFVADARPDLNSTLRLFAEVCDGVNAAHLRGVIHRDLKPANVLVDENQRPRVVDFGLAKLVADPAGNESSIGETQTAAGQFLGSLPWASPEQAAGDNTRIDIRTDVYSLGVILYQLLTGGRFPYDVTGPVRDVLNRIVTTGPARPRAARPRAASSPDPSIPRSLDPFSIDSDLEAIVLNCLSKDPDRRYQTAGELARDIRHYLAGEAIEARRDSRWYVLRKSLRRHRIPIGIAAAFFALLTAGFISTLLLWQRAERNAEETNQVADVHARMLSEVRVEIMGARMREDVLELASQGWRLSQPEVSEQTLSARRGELETLLADTDFTATAVRSLERNIFDRALSTINAEFGNQPLIRARLLQSLADTLLGLDLLASAKAAQDEALAIRRRELGNVHPDTLSSIHKKAQSCNRARNFAEGETYAREAMDGRARLFGPEHQDTLASKCMVGRALFLAGRYSEAEAAYREVLPSLRRVLGDDHKQTLRILFWLAQVLVSQDRHADAEPFLQEAMERHPRSGSNDLWPVLVALRGSLRENEGRFDEAADDFRDALQLQSEAMGSDHRETLFTRAKLGRVLRRQNKLAEAEIHLEIALEGLKRARGNSSVETIWVKEEMGWLRGAQRRFDEAEAFMCVVLTHRQRELGERRGPTLWAHHSLGNLRRDQGRLAEAEVDLLAAADGMWHLKGDTPATRKMMKSLIGLYDAWHKTDPAAGYDTRASEWRSKLESLETVKAPGGAATDLSEDD